VTAAEGDERQGMTVSSFTSVSLSPPLILVSLETASATCKFVAKTQSFAVAILAENQRALSDRFAGREPELEDRFTGLDLHISPSGHPIPSGALAFIDCNVVDQLKAGTHTVFIAEVLRGDVLLQNEPLLYFDRAYRKLGTKGS
jgi:3-hydroxy-9,10-secoandrosta-1,3,5(10)-triene-9,17-dione monooxygenase reductase component